LAKARATAVKKFLSAWFDSKELQHSIRVKAVGSKKPVKPNDSESNRMKNRRVEVSIANVVS
jgi:flagellar motor protein MotB